MCFSRFLTLWKSVPLLPLSFEKNLDFVSCAKILQRESNELQVIHHLSTFVVSEKNSHHFLNGINFWHSDFFSAFQHYSLLSFLLPFFLVALEGQRSIFDLLEWPQTTLTCYKSSKNVENSSGARRNQNKNCKIQTLFPLDDSNKNEERVVARAHFLLLLTWAEFLMGL